MGITYSIPMKKCSDMMAKKNFLFILPWLPYPLKSGGHQAIFNGIRAVVDDYNVFITYDEDEAHNCSLDQAELIKTLGSSIKVIPFKKQREKDSASFLFRCYVSFWNLK